MANKTATIKLKDKNGVEYEVFVRWTWNSMKSIEKELGAGFLQVVMNNMGFTSASVLLLHGLRGAAEQGALQITLSSVENRLQDHLDGGGSFPSVIMQIIDACKALGLLERDGQGGNPTE